jgi:hypothetical protein
MLNSNNYIVLNCVLFTIPGSTLSSFYVDYNAKLFLLRLFMFAIQTISYIKNSFQKNLIHVAMILEFFEIKTYMYSVSA